MKSPLRVAARVTLFWALFAMAIMVLNDLRRLRENRESGIWILHELTSFLDYHPSLAEALGYQPNDLWMAESVPEFWIADWSAHGQPRFSTVAELRDLSRSQPTSVIRISSLPRSAERHHLFTLSRWRYWWNGEQWMKKKEGDGFRIAVVKIDGIWVATPLIPTATSCP